MIQLINRFKIVYSALLIIAAIACNTQSPATKPVLPDSASVKAVTEKQSFQDSLPKPGGFINDYEGLFTPMEKDSLETMIKLFEKETTIEIAVITMDSTITTAENLDKTTLQIAKAWGVGQKDKNNGIAIGVSKQFRKMRIENGNGIAKIFSDAETKQVVDEDFIPSFKQGNYYEGVKKGLLSLMQKLRKKYTA